MKKSSGGYRLEFARAGLSLKHELSSLGQRINLNSLNDWEEKCMEYLEDLRIGVEGLKNVAPQNDEERHQVFLLKKQIVDTLIHKATIDRNRKIMVDSRLNLLAIFDQDAKSTMLDLAYIGKGETYPRIRSARAHRHHSSSCE